MKNQDLSRIIDKIAEVDQNVQHDILSNNNKMLIDSLENVKNNSFIKNCIKCKEIFKKYGFPSISEVGAHSSYNFWLIVQHCDEDIAFQKNVLNAMKKLVRANDVDLAAYAYLHDRVMINSEKKQKYGTQVSYRNGEPYIKNLINPKKVNLRRLKVGLESIEDYLKIMKPIIVGQEKSK